MKKSYIIASIAIAVVFIGILGFYLFDKHGPGSDKAMLKGRIEYMLESCGCINKGKDTWSNYKGNPNHIAISNPQLMAERLHDEKFDSDEAALASLMLGSYYKIKDTNHDDNVYVITVEIIRKDGSTGNVLFVFQKQGGSWVMENDCLERAVYIANGQPGDVTSIGGILDLVTSL